ncbi:nicotinate phosphoribosyltransferase [Adlercreutzia sp. ZJ304]|uniref:nicotinate phosphoribosyltransferase n=1 Tax=Adlercreutzia sp. ZJ304 TaxID=2709791 RepID=UPI0013EA9FE1|nr:nicotinate phosphoribosyltransferase [Adlercreutzia sp. ZJ304]
MRLDWALYTDLYQITMAQAYWASNKIDDQATFTMFFRDYPFNGGYAVACGMEQLTQMLADYSFSQEDIDYLASVKSPDGTRMFDADFLKFLMDMRLNVDIEAVAEGTIVFPYEPIMRVSGPIMQCQLLETMLLNCVNFQTLIATKAARICRATHGMPVAEFGLRRAQGTGGLWASRAAFVGGCASTSNVLAGKLYGIPVSGTHSHSWVMSFESELEAFREYARSFPSNCTLLVDTYDVEEGVRNAIKVGLEMRQRGEKLSGIRIDSGDLAWLARKARKMLDDAGLTDVGIVLSNDLDERTVESIMDEGAPVNAWGIGTRLATGYDQPTLGGVYKLSAIKPAGSNTWKDRLKISESAAKLTMPGVLNVRRYFNEDGHVAGDMVYDVNSKIDASEVIVDPMDPLRQKQLKGKRNVVLLQPFIRNGAIVCDKSFTDAKVARNRASEQLETLDETQLRMLNPHTYPVGLERGLHERRQNLVAQLRSIDR